MKRLLLLAFLPLLAACSSNFNVTHLAGGKPVVGSGNIVSMTVDAVDFDSIDVGSIYEVDISLGDEFRVFVETDDNVMERLEIRESGGVLHLGTTRGSHNFRDVTLRASVQLPFLRSVQASGACSISLAEIACSDLDVRTSGASKVSGQLVCDEALDVEASGASRISLTGMSGALDGNSSGASKLQLGDMEVGRAELIASGASRIEVDVKDELSAEASGAAKIRYQGEPRISKSDRSGAASIHRS